MENYPKNVLVADNGTEDELGGGSEVASLSETLINALGRLSISEELSVDPPDDPVPQANHVHADGRSRPSMGKPLQLIADHYYFLARCPATGSILDAIVDDTAGTGAPLTGEWRVTCTDCDRVHALNLSTIWAERFVMARTDLDEM